MADGTFTIIQNSVGKKLWTDQQGKRKITRIHKFDMAETDLPLFGIGGNWIIGFHFIWGQNDSKWHRACEIQGVKKTFKKSPKGSVYAVELDIDGYLTLRGDIRAATFGNCPIVEPHQQRYTQDFRFKIDKALRERGLQKAHIIEWYHLGVGHRADGSLILDTTQIKPPRWAASGQGGQASEKPEYTRISPQPQEREYRDCGRCRKPAAKLKCACLATHYCDIQCQREDMPVHRQICTHMILKEINLSQSQLKQHQETHGMFTVEVAKLELLLTEMHIKIADLLRTSRNGTIQEQSEHHYIQALQRVARLVSQTFLKQRPSLLYNLRTDQVAAHLGLGCLYRDQKLDQGAMEHLEKAHDLTQELTTIEDSPGQQDRLGVILTIQEKFSMNQSSPHQMTDVELWKNKKWR